MAVTITAVTLVGGNPPTQVQITGSYTNCEKLDFWVSCNQAKPARQLTSQTVASPFSIFVDIPRSCGCGDTIWVWADCHQGLGVPSAGAASVSVTFDCDCCPQVSIAAPSVSYPGGVPTASFALSAPVTWIPPGCNPPVNITGYQWTLTQGVTEFQLTTSTANAGTDAGNWTKPGSAIPPALPLSLAAGSWDVKVRPTFSTGVLSANCDTSDSTTFTVVGAPPSQCCPGEPKSAPNGVSVSAVATGTVPNVTATFTATIHWNKCPVVAPTTYAWQVTDPSGRIFTRETPANVTYSSDPGANWVLGGAQIGALPLTTGGAYTVVCTVVFPANTTASSCPTFGSSQFSVAGMQPPPVPTCCPNVGLSAVITGSTATFSATTTWPAGCTNTVATSFIWTVTDKSTNSTFVKTTPASTTDQTGFSPPLTLSPGDSYNVSVTPSYPGVALPQGCNPTGVSMFQAPGSTTTPPSGSGSGSGSIACIFLLVASIVLMILGGIVFAVGYCIGIFWVWIIGLALAAVGVVLFILWAILCANKTPCSLMLTMECILDWIVRTGWIAAVVAGIIGGLPCGLASFAVWGGWSILDNFLRTIMFRVGCPPIDCTKARA